MAAVAIGPVLDDPSGDQWRLQLDLAALNRGAAQKSESDALHTVEPTKTAIAATPEGAPAPPGNVDPVAAGPVATAARDAKAGTYL